MPNTPKGKLIQSSIVGFCLLFLIDWSGITGRRFPKNWGEALVQVCINIGWILFFAVVSYFALIRRRSRHKDEVSSSMQMLDERRRGDSWKDPQTLVAPNNEPIKINKILQCASNVAHQFSIAGHSTATLSGTWFLPKFCLSNKE
jgi:hypothetical protein